MWAQGNHWNQMPLDAAAYQNVNHDLVDWASLAQQWIRMKEVHKTVVLNVPQIAQNHFPNNSNLTESQSMMMLHSSDSILNSGEAPMDVEKEDESTPSSSDWCWQTQTSSQPTQSQPVLNQQPPSWSIQHGPYVARPVFSQAFHPGVPTSLNFSPRMPLLPLPSARPTSSDEDSLGASSFNSIPTLDASKRKNLPAWIREGLEKMEKEKLKKEEREKFLMERELRRQRELELRDVGEISTTRSRFDDSDDGEEDVAEEPIAQLAAKKQYGRPVASDSESVENIMVRIRQLMTEILLEVTTEDIRSAALEASQLGRAVVKTRQAQSPMSSKSLTQKLGLDQYGSDSEEDSSQETSRVQHTSDDDGEDCSDVKTREKQQLTDINQGERSWRTSQADNSSIQPGKVTNSKGLDQNHQNDKLSMLQDGSKVETDITNNFSHGQDQPAALITTHNEDSIVNGRKVSDSKNEISAGGAVFTTSRTPESRKRSSSRDGRYTSRRSSERERSKSKRRSRSRERKRSYTRRRSRSRSHRRSRSRSHRRSRSRDRNHSVSSKSHSSEQKSSSRKGREIDRKKTERKH